MQMALSQLQWNEMDQWLHEILDRESGAWWTTKNAKLEGRAPFIVLLTDGEDERLYQWLSKVRASDHPIAHIR